MVNYYLDNYHMTYDYIIVGAGPAGCVLAKELSEDRKCTVLLIEAGDNNDKDIQIRDSTTNTTLYFPQYFWQGNAVPQINLNNKIFEWTGGRLAGGGSSVNGEQYVRPSTAVLTEWEKIAGHLWGPHAAISNFEEIENNHGPGRLNIQQRPHHIPLMTEKLVAAIEQGTGYNIIDNYNDPNTPIGPFARWQLTQKPNGERESASTAFLSQEIVDSYGYGLDGRKLTVSYNSTALRILFNSQKEAVAVKFLKEGKCLLGYARKKIIISAGINSTQLLILSGIGPANYLRSLNIPVVFNNPNVGLNLANHTINTASFATNPADIDELLVEPDALYVGGAFLPAPSDDRNKRSIQLIGAYGNETLNILIVLLDPKSKGNIIIQNNDPLKIVLADYNIFENEEDLELLKSVYRTYIRNIAQELALLDSHYQLISPSFDIIDDDDLLEQFIIDNLSMTYHQQSSLRMAPYSEGGVVDNVGRVYGVNNLVVADCSIIPTTTDGNTQAASYLIGYTIAKQLVLEDQARAFSNSAYNSVYPYYQQFYG